MSPTHVPSGKQSSNAVVERWKISDATPGPEPSLHLSSVYRRQSKGGLRDLFSKNRSTMTLASTPETDEISLANTNTSTHSTRDIDSAWAPPLFQVYPQSIKHINLEASTLSAHSIIRMNEHKSTTLLHESETSTTRLSREITPSPRQPHRVSASISKTGWTRKVYVLTTSGHLLQYSVEGSLDRKPEKVLQLGKDSAAFASDAIEGRHFVLHVSHSCSEDGEQDLNSSKGLFSRIGIKTSIDRRSTKVLLMVFNTAESLDEWLTAIRSIIGSLGGRAYSLDSPEVDLKTIPKTGVNQPHQVQKESQHLRQEVSPVELQTSAAEERPSTRSSTYTTTELERLRDSKTSNLSVMTGTPSSLIESPPSSPVLGKVVVSDAPRLELPDMGPSSLFDFSKQGRRQSRLSLIISDITRHKYVESKPIAKSSHQGSWRVWPTIKKNPSMPDVEQGQSPKLDQSQESLECIKAEGKEPSDDKDDKDDHERPVSTLAPLPAVFASRQAMLEPPSTKRYSRLFSTPPETASQLPKRYSSLGYSRSVRRSDIPPVALSPPPPPENNPRRPVSMQLHTESTSSAATSPPASSLRPSEQESLKFAATTKHWTQYCPRGVNSSFGPPVSPPPDCPLPAVPTDALPWQRQSIAMREIMLSQDWGENPPDFF